MISSRVNILNGCLKGYPFGSTAQKKSVPGRSENRSSPSSSHPLCHLSNFNHFGGSQTIPCESGKHLKLPGMNPSTLPSWARLLMLRVAVELQCFIPITSDPGCDGHFDTAEISTVEYIAALNIKWEHTLGCNMMQQILNILDSWLTTSCCQHQRIQGITRSGVPLVPYLPATESHTLYCKTSG
jgi:hypothetical protein